MDWAEIIDLLGESCSADHFRKVARGIYEAYTKGGQGRDALKEIEKRKEDLIKERQKLQATKHEYNRNLRHESRFELLYENIRDAIIKLPSPVVKYIPSAYSGTDRHLMLLADVHYGAKFKVANNEYSPEICKRRFEFLLSETINYIKFYDVGHLDIIGLGDDLQGILRVSDLSVNEIPVVNAVVQYSRLLASFLRELSEYVEIDYYPVQSSNHTQTRPLGTKASELATEDLEKIIANYVADLLFDNERTIVHTEFSDRPVVLNINGFSCIALHGHEVRNIKTALKDLSHLYREFYDYVFIGHYHLGNVIDSGASDMGETKTIVAPAFCGGDPYSVNKLTKASAPAVLMCRFSNEGLSGTKTIFLRKGEID